MKFYVNSKFQYTIYTNEQGSSCLSYNSDRTGLIDWNGSMRAHYTLTPLNIQTYISGNNYGDNYTKEAIRFVLNELIWNGIDL